MYGLAQVLIQDSRRGQQGQHLSTNREIARGLTDQLIIELKKNSVSKEGVAIQEYLTHALGLMDTLEVTGPGLYMAMEPLRDIDIRKSAVISLSLVAGRAFDLKHPLNTPESVEALVNLSTDSLPILRQSAAFALGLFDSPEATHQLEVLLDGPDQLTRVNAAIGLARHDSTAGYRVIADSLKFSNVMKLPLTAIGVDEKASAVGEQFLVVKNLLNAVAGLAPRFDQEQRQQLIPLVEQLSNEHAELSIRVAAAAALGKLKEAAADQAK
jgi:HEAT repeat protein